MKNKTNNNFDVLRLLLAILVFSGHWNILVSYNSSNFILNFHSFSVDIFFIISGFLIFWSYDNDQEKKHFYIKRFFRIFPLYVFLILLQTLFFIGFSDGNFAEIVQYCVANIFFLNFLAPSVGTTLSSLEVDAINGSLWTLKNEVVFYALVPFIFMSYKKWGDYFLMILYSLSVVYMFAVDYLNIAKLLVQFPAQLRLFLVGILLYVLFDKFKDKNITLLAIGSLILIVLFKDFDSFMFSIYPLLLGVLLIYLVYFVKHIKIDFDFSYSFYILHFPVIQLALYFGINPSNPLVSFLSLFGVILVLSYFSEKYIEKRFVGIGKNIVKKDRKNEEK